MAGEEPQGGPARRFPGGINSKIFAIGHKPFKGLNTQLPRDSIDDAEFSWLENMQPIGNSLFSLNDVGSSLTAGGTADNPIIYFYMFNSDQVQSGFSGNVSQYVFIAYQAGNGTVISATSSAIIDNITSTGIFNPGQPVYSSPACQATQYNDGGIVIMTDGTANGYYAADQSGFYAPGSSAPFWLVDNVTGQTLPTSIRGYAVSVWQQRLWYARGVLYASSAPSNGVDFTIGNGATSQLGTDPFIRTQYMSLAQANGFLYIFGDSSVNVISNIQSSGSPTVTTTFNNQNVDPQIGASWPNTVQAFGRGLIYANTTGVYALFGGASQKISDQLDGIFDAMGHFTNLSLVRGPSSAVAMINNQRCYMLLIPLKGPLDTISRNALVVWDGKKWFVASQSISLTFIATQMISSLPMAWGTDGLNLYPLFGATTGTKISKVWQTKLFNGDGLWITKSAYRLFTSIIDNAGTGVTESGTIDSLLTFAGLQQQSFSQQTSPGIVTWINGSSGVVQFQNSLNQNIIWTNSGESEIIGTGLQINARGNRLGWTSTSMGSNFELTEELMIYQEQSPIGG